MKKLIFIIFLLVASIGLMASLVQAQQAQIYGWVHKSSTEYITNVHVVAYNANNGIQAGDGFTDGVGFYSLFLSPGTYIMAFYPPQGPPFYLDQWYNNKLYSFFADQIVLTEGSMIDISPTLVRGGAIEGKVTSDGTTGIPLIAIQAFDASLYNTFTWGDTLNDGTYRIMVPGGDGTPKKYWVLFNPYSQPPNGINYLPEAYDSLLFNYGIPNPPPTLIDVYNDTITPNINAQLELGGIITGTVSDIDTGDPIPYACVSGAVGGHWMYQTRTGSNYYPTEPGRYYLTIPPGDGWTITAFDCSFGEYDAYILNQSITLTSPVLAGQTYPDEINFTPAKGGKISGIVYDADTGFPVRNACIVVEDANGNYITGTGLTGVDGFYKTPTLAVGPYYKLRVDQCNASGEYSFPKYYNDLVPVTRGVTVGGKNIGLNKAGTISATIVNSSPTPRGISNVWVSAVNSLNGAFVAGGNTNSDGFTSFNVPAGNSYRINYDTYNSEGYYLSKSYNNGAPFSISAGETKTINDTLTTGSVVSLDLKPGIYPNLIKICEENLTAAILSTNDLNANKIELGTVTLQGIQPSDSIPQDVNNDGKSDLVLTFPSSALNFSSAPSSTALTLAASIDDRGTPVPVTGSDFIFVYETVIPPTVFDDFYSGTIDTLKWSFTTPIQTPPPTVLNRELIIENSIASLTSSKASGLFFKNSTGINSYKAKVKIIEFNTPNGGYATADLGGFYYNDTFSTPNYTSGLGNIFARVSIGGNGTTPVASWSIIRTQNANYTQFSVLESGTIPVNITIGEVYTLFIGWNGSEFTFSVDGVEVRRPGIGNIFPASNILKYVRTYLSPPSPGATYSANIIASFDDIEIPAMANYTPSCDTEPVQVQPVDTSTGQNPVTITYDQVTQAGVTTLSTSSTGPTPPAGFQLGDPPTYYHLETTASVSGPRTVCINYSGIPYGDESQLRLFHYEYEVWTDITTSQDMGNNIICGESTSFSSFVIVVGILGRKLGHGLRLYRNL